MKFGAHCYIFTDRWSDAHLGLLDTARELGLDGFEIGVGDDIIFDAAATRRRAAALGIELSISPGGVWPMECDLSAADPVQRRHALEWHRHQVELGAELGAVAYAGALYGHPGVLQYRLPSAEDAQHIADGLHALAESGARYGIRIVIEPMSHFRTHLVNTTEQAMRLITRADHPNLHLLFDTYHLVTEIRDYGAALRLCGDRLWGLHACESDRGVPGGGLVPWPQIFAALREMHFDGHLVLESYNSNIPGFATRRGMLHNVCPDGRAFVESGLAFLRECLAQASAAQHAPK